MRASNVVMALLVVVLLGAGGILGSVGLDFMDELAATNATNEQLSQELAQLEEERAALESLTEEVQVRFARDALSDLVSRSIEAGEVLGAGVRIGTGDGNIIQFQPLKHGLQVARVELQAASELTPAPALMSLLEEELKNLPVSVRAVSARLQTDVVAIKLEVDVYGR